MDIYKFVLFIEILIANSSLIEDSKQFGKIKKQLRKRIMHILGLSCIIDKKHDFLQKHKVIKNGWKI